MNLTDIGLPFLTWALRTTMRFADYLDRWVQALDPGETGWMDE